jgi:hypothetical protein
MIDVNEFGLNASEYIDMHRYKLWSFLCAKWTTSMALNWTNLTRAVSSKSMIIHITYKKK